MEKYFPYDIANPQAITGEQHKISGGQIRLRHIPAEGSIKISGFTEKNSPAGLQAKEFYCYYARDTQYRDSNRIVWFSTAKNGTTVSVSYDAVGTVFTADDANEIKYHLENSEQQLLNFAFALDNQANDILALKRQIATIGAADINAHNASHDAHQFIQGLITTEETARQRADTNLQSSITSEISARQSGDNELRGLINGAMKFVGVVTNFPANPSEGWFVFKGEEAYVFDGSNWILLKGAGGDSSTDVSTDDFLTTIYGNRPHDGYNAFGKTDFLTYVFGDATPSAYVETGGISKPEFINYVFEE